jgi:predicted regulator of Ras-like GTPase activity (Roadblock/LC7/MglB family)
MDAQQALADLTEISSQIEAAVLFGPRGGVTASTVAETDRARELAHKAADLLHAAEAVKAGTDEALTQLEVATTQGSIFVVREGDKRIAATTAPQPTVGLVFYDLKSCLRSLDDEQEHKPEPTRTREKADAP